MAAAARGERSDYALEPRPLNDEGGQAVVFRARHKGTDAQVAFKRVRAKTREGLSRMRHEIEIGRKLAEHRCVMPVLDASPSSDWFVMPLAVASAVDRRARLAADHGVLRRFVESVARGVGAGHAKGWVHRDIKPANILRLSDGDKGRWVVADWGLGRGPRGQTTSPGRTRVGEAYGTRGFAAPELAVDAHGATAAADVWSLGQLVGWVVTGKMPLPNLPLLPDAGPWRGIVRVSTDHDPARRPQSAQAFLDLVAEELSGPLDDLFVQAAELINEANGGAASAAAELFRLCDRHNGNHALLIDELPKLRDGAIPRAVADQPGAVRAVMVSMADHLDGDWGDRPFKWADDVIALLFGVAKAAAAAQEVAVLEEALEALFAWDERWDQRAPQPAIRAWLRGLRGDMAHIAAAALRRHPDAAAHFREVADDGRADVRIRAAVRAG